MRHLGTCGSISRMLKTKRVALSVRVSEHARDALYRKAEREGHRYPAAFAAVLLERAVEAPPASGAASDWVSELRVFARFHGAYVVVDGARVTLNLTPPAGQGVCKAFATDIMAYAPPPAGVVFDVKAVA